VDITTTTITTEAQLRDLIGEPTDLVVSKIADHLNELTRPFVERSPFLCLATSDALGNCDVSPRGDPAGFVRILDDRTVLIPERPGNRIADSLRNIIANPHVGVLFLIPGVTDTFRINGRAKLTTDAELLALSSIEGKLPRLGIVIEIDVAYTQCSKAFLRSDLWNPDGFVERSCLATNGEIMEITRREANPEASFDATEYDAARTERYARREGFY
jgi:uncharacterized protein